MGGACFRYVDDVEHDLDAVGVGGRVDWHDAVRFDRHDAIEFGSRVDWHDAISVGVRSGHWG